MPADEVRTVAMKRIFSLFLVILSHNIVMQRVHTRFCLVICLALFSMTMFSPACFAQLEIVGELTLNRHVGRLASDGNYAYVASSDSPQGESLYVIDVSNPHDPTLITSLRLARSCEGMSLDGTLLYVAQTLDGFRIVDVSNPEEPYFIGECDSATHCHDVVAEGAFAYTASCYRVCVADVSGPYAPDIIWNDYRDLEIRNIRRGKQRLFAISRLVSDFSYIVTAYDISSPAVPVFLRVHDEDYDIRDVGANGDIVYMICGDSTLRVIDYSDAQNPRQIGSCPISPYAWRIELSHDFAVITTACFLQIVDISNPTNPVSTDVFDYPYVFYQIAVNDYIYVAGGFRFDQFYILGYRTNVSDEDDSDFPGRPSLSQNYPNPFNSSTVISYLLPPESSATLSIFDILGRAVRQLEITGQQNQALWDGTDDSGRPVASGLYFYSIDDRVETARKMLLLR